MANDSDFLRALLSEDGEDGEGDQDDPRPQPVSDNKTMKQVRDTIKRLENQLTKVQRERDQLAEFKTSVVRTESKAKVAEAFGKVYGDASEAERNTKLFFRGIPEDAEITEDQVTEYLREFGPSTPAPQPGQVQQSGPVSDNSGGLAPTPGGTPPVQGMVSSDDMLKMLAEGNFDELAKASEAGRLQKAQYGWPTEGQE
jgi:hypothetical protein